jgi:two-component system cell cycle response regulator DivK
VTVGVSPEKLRILVVDDDADVRETVVELLQLQGYDVLEAASGGEGIEVARGARPHLILMDFNMPELLGPEAVALLRQDVATRKIPVVALTGSAGVAAKELVKAGCIAYIPKPIDLDAFPGLIAGLLAATAPKAPRTP